jgi:Pentapeptide repeats (9 copies)
VSEQTADHQAMQSAGRHVARAREAFVDLARRAQGSRETRQACAADLCAWLRLACGTGPGAGAAPRGLHALAADAWAFLGERLRTTHDDLTFSGLDLDVSGTQVTGAVFGGARFSGGQVSFADCHFDAEASFAGAQFTGASVSFRGAEFRGAAHFEDTRFSGGEVDFDGMRLAGARLWLARSEFSGSEVRFTRAQFAAGTVSLAGCRITGGEVSFRQARLNVPVSFDSAVIRGGALRLDHAESAEDLSLHQVEIVGGSVTLTGLTLVGGQVNGDGLVVAGGRLALDRMRIRSGTLALGAASFLAGSVSMTAIVLESDGALDLPWARYTAHRSVVKDQEFTGGAAHDFYAKVASYRPTVSMDWGVFGPPSATA